MSSESTSSNKIVIPVESVEFSSDNSQTPTQASPPLLPRSGWNNKLAFLRVMLKAKRALDHIEKESGTME
ncbi:MAG: hypothetical protein WA919_26690 [Coleofasciculaceae cyanobacterium]